MTEIKKEVEIVLTEVLSYTPKGSGEMKEAISVILTPPSLKQLKHTTVLKQSFFQAISSMADDKASSDDSGLAPEMAGSDVIAMIFMSDVNVTAMFDSAKELFKSGVAKLDGTQDFNDIILNKLSVEDFENMVGEYLVNFILASTLKKMNSSK